MGGGEILTRRIQHTKNKDKCTVTFTFVEGLKVSLKRGDIFFLNAKEATEVDKALIRWCA